MNEKERDALDKLLRPYTDLPLECDGLTRVISYVLRQERIGHTCYNGNVSYDDGNQGILTHFWILTETSILIDYRLGLWLIEAKDKPLPFGPHNPKKYPYIEYLEWTKVDMSIGKAIFDILTVNKDYWHKVFQTGGPDFWELYAKHELGWERNEN